MSRNEYLTDVKFSLHNKDNNIWCIGEVYTKYHKEQIEQVFNSLSPNGAVDLRGITVSNKYITKPGENLSIIAERVYGDQSKWQFIFAANLPSIKDPNKILPYQEIILPEIKLTE